MAWKKVIQQMSFRREVMVLADQPGAKVSQVCERFKISRKTFYKWRSRWKKAGESGLKNQSRRPHRSPNRTSSKAESQIVALRKKRSSWGARKLRRRLSDLGQLGLPAPSTVHAILRRNGMIEPAESEKHQPWTRFEHEAPNQLWQMDFKGWFVTDDGRRCHPLTILDDHSRYVVCLQSCGNQRTETVQLHLTETFRRYGLPVRMSMDNGSPWGNDAEHRHTPLTVWLMRLGIAVSHSRPFHPQTQGKDERFHRTLKADLLQSGSFRDLKHVQRAFEPYRQIYNHERPHQALGMAVPATRYQVSPRAFPEALPPIEYDTVDTIRRVSEKGWVRFRGMQIPVGKAFYKYPVAIRPTTEDPVFDVYFSRYRITRFDFRTAQ